MEANNAGFSCALQVIPAVRVKALQARLASLESIHSRIKRLRLAKALSQTDLATRAGVKYQSVQEWERENGTAPTRKRMQAVAKALDVSPTELMTGEARPASAVEDIKPREEILLLLFRGLFSHQQQELVGEMRALFDANQYVRKEMGLKALHGVSNEDVAGAFGAVPAPKDRPKSRTAKHRQGGNRGLDDPDAE